LAQITDLDIAVPVVFSCPHGMALVIQEIRQGIVVGAIPADWNYKEFTDLKKASVSDLAGLLKSKSAGIVQSARKKHTAR
jgi:hypothetical protein